MNDLTSVLPYGSVGFDETTKKTQKFEMPNVTQESK
jgi:hypothetical protein